MTLRHRLSADLPFSHPENTTKKERLLKDNTIMAKKARLRCLIWSIYKVGTTQSIASLLQTMQQMYLKSIISKVECLSRKNISTLEYIISKLYKTVTD